MVITRVDDGDIVQLRLSGSVDSATSPTVEAAVTAAFDDGKRRLIFDLRNVGYFSSAGLRIILLATKRAKAGGGAVALYGLQPGVREVFSVAGIGKIVAITDDEQQARDRIAGSDSADQAGSRT